MVGPHGSSCQRQAMLHSQARETFPANPSRCRGTSPFLQVRGGRPREVKRLPKAIQPLGVELELNPNLLFPIYRPQLGLLRAEEMNFGERQGDRGKGPPLLGGTGWVPQAPECRAKAKVGYKYQLAEPSRDKWAAPGNGEIPIKRGSESSDAHVSERHSPSVSHVTHSQSPSSSVPATTPFPWLHEVPESLTPIPSVPRLSGILILTG